MSLLEKIALAGIGLYFPVSYFLEDRQADPYINIVLMICAMILMAGRLRRWWSIMNSLLRIVGMISLFCFSAAWLIFVWTNDSYWMRLSFVFLCSLVLSYGVKSVPYKRSLRQ